MAKKRVAKGGGFGHQNNYSILSSKGSGKPSGSNGDRPAFLPSGVCHDEIRLGYCRFGASCKSMLHKGDPGYDEKMSAKGNGGKKGGGKADGTNGKGVSVSGGGGHSADGAEG